MATADAFRDIALSMPGAVELPHFDKTSFRINRKIFATLDTQRNTAVVKLSPVDQSAFCAFDASVIRPVRGAWGRQGWTQIDLAKVRQQTLRDAVKTAFAAVGKQSRRKK